MASWKLLEEMMIELKKKDVAIPPNILNDLRSAKLMIQLSSGQGDVSDAMLRAEELSANLEAYLLTEGQKVFGSERIDAWLRRLEEANAQPVATAKSKVEDKYIVGVPRDQKWVRVEPMANLPAQHIEQLAKEHSLTVKPQQDGRLVVYGSQANIREFLKKMIPTKPPA